ncbi:MAG: patatin-like phospholipase family protein [Gammaproteobacteria bacterium]|nr:patatin-like phospholipase family protein [Gammaproteobacteria bacterium]
MIKLRLGILLSLMIFISSCATPPANISIPSHEPPPLTLTKHPRVALVLGGGGARGYAHVGVIKALQKAGVPIDLIVGTSAGSIIGALYADSANSVHVERTMRKTHFFDFADFTIVSSGNGFISGRKLQHFLLKNMQAKSFEELKIPLVVVATDLKSGKEKPLSSGPIAPAVNASSAMPGAVHPVKMYGLTLVDGGMVAQLPVKTAKHFHPDIIIAVNIDADFDKKMPTSFVGVFQRAFDISIQTIGKFSGEGADVLIHPSVGNAGIFDVHLKHTFIVAGEKAAQEALPQIKELLIKNSALTANLKPIRHANSMIKH